ncbi:hypothetical protein WUBG_00337 [Wuchereria bancrofti]|uniref:Uncharacterized protein n=1 Tax=Wuchereria bancrofti TaxID=6293 RepID=J9BMH0_WUCBA|nr:hypothetical protein WUBG_00337 [Wuchereria bancrofti]
MMIVSAYISIVRVYTLLRSNIIPKRQLMPYSADECVLLLLMSSHETSKNDGISDFFVDERNDHFPHERFRRRSAKSFLVPVIRFWILYTVVFTYCDGLICCGGGEAVQYSAMQSTEDLCKILKMYPAYIKNILAVIIALDVSAAQSVAAIKKHLLWDES